MSNTVDLYGTLNPAYKDGAAPRFKLYVREVRTDTPPEYSHELTFVDHKYRDSDGYPIDAIAAGESWEAAFKLAGQWVTEAINSDHCIF